MKKLITGIISFTLLFTMIACGNKEVAIKDDAESKAKTGENATPKGKSREDKKSSNDVWTYYEDAKWSDDFKGLKSEIKKVVVSDQAPGFDDEGEEIITSAVGVKFKMENTTDGQFTTYPNQAELVTSTGEQIEADLWVSDDLGGEIDKGVIKEGDIVWYLDRGEAESIEWIKMKWDAYKGKETDIGEDRKEYEVELNLK